VTPRTRLLLVIAAVAALVIAFVIASGSGDDSSSTGSTSAASTPAASTPAETSTGGAAPAQTQTTPAAPAVPVVPVVSVTGGKPEGGVQRLEFAKGDTIRFRVRSDVADEVHVHGYDVKKDVPAGGTVTFAFPATIDGRFEVELETRAEQIAELEVTP
jgi:hypothetical protein